MTVAVQSLYTPVSLPITHRLKPLVAGLEPRWGCEDCVRIAHTGCETGRFLPFAGVRCVLKMPYDVRR